MEKDVKDALQDIARDFRSAKHANRIQAGDLTEVYKYRQKCTDLQRGARGGWRIVAVYVKRKDTLYPVIIYPKTEMDDVSDAAIQAKYARS